MKKVLSILLTIIMLFTMVPANVFAAGTTTVKLVSFMRGDVTDLRSSELLEVQVEGYDGNPRELTYKWTSSLGTYLYIYNSHNMYGINNTYGEYEIYNTGKKVNRSTNVEENRAGDKTLSKVGFMWAAVYGAYSKESALQGTVKVEVFDKNGKSLGSDSFSSFKRHNLDRDIDNVVIGLFVGEEMNMLDLLGRSGVVHITCTESSVSKAQITSGKDKISVTTKSGDYYVKGVSAGQSQIDITIKKENCKFHNKTSGSAAPVVYVFKNPTTSTTTTTLTLDKNSIDDRCEYFIDGNKGEKQPDGSILFTGLTPNTEYTVEVRAEYKDGSETKYVYSYVEDTTKPAYKATVKTYLDNTITDVSAVHGADVALYLRKNGAGAAYIELSKTAVGTYEAVVDNGTYFLWHYENGSYHLARNYELIIEHANAELSLHHYSVKYDTNGGAFKAGEEVGTEIYPARDAANATSNVPVREGFIFAGWDYSGKVIGSGKQITSSISSPITLKAKWEKAVNVTINVTIDHKTADGFDPNPTRTDLDVDFLEMTASSPAFVETGDKLYFREEKTTDEKGNEKAYTYSIENNVSTYTATDYTYTGLLESSTFGVALSKSGYDVGAIEKRQDRLGNWVINIPLTYNPDDFDLDFSIEMADDVPTELYPDAVIVKIAYWNTETNEWKIISQQETKDSVVKPGVRVDIDPVTGEGFGSYPVWRFDGDNNPYGYRAVVTGFIYGDSTIIVPTEKDHIKDDNTVIVTYTDGNYTATMGDIADGNKFSTSLNGAYYNGATNAQQGTLDGVITIEKYDVIFDANGGEIKGGNTYTEKDEYYVPDTGAYVPTFGEHTFKGWYKDPEFKEPAVTGELLTENVTLYAKWDQILTGNVRVAGSYMQDGKVVDVWAVDRADSAVIVLQEITDNGVYNIDRQTVNIVWPRSEMLYGISGEYKFTGLDPEKEYRTEVLILNYGTTYQNSTTAVDGDDDYADDYNANDFTAIYPESSKWKTFVNAYLSFEPASYFQPVEVDATLIGENLRPDDTLVQVWYKEIGSGNAYQVISQHTVVPYGIEIDMGADGMDNGDYGYSVWNSVYNGNLYDYQAHLDKIEGEEVSEWPVSVVYGSPSRYSPLHDAPTGVLQVKIIPNRYDVIYHEYYIDEETEVTSNDTHTWSYKTDIDYEPVRDGYIFRGWYNNAECTGAKVTEIAETVAENTNLYAKWEKRSDLELTVNYVEKSTNDTLATETKTAQVFGDVIEAASLKKEFKGFTFDSASADNITIGTGTNEITLYYARNNYGYTVNYLEEGTEKVLAAAKTGEAVFEESVTENAIAIDGYTLTSGNSKTITIGTEDNVINFYYAADNFGGGENGDEGDGTPDKYQKKVIFKVVNGAWADGTAADKFIYLDLMKDGEYAVDGTAELTAPTGMIANNGYTGGLWDVTPPTEVNGTATETYTFSFVKRTDLVLTVKHIVLGEGTVLGSEAKENLTFGDVITAESLIKDFKGFTFDSASENSITIGTGTNEITLYYVRNSYDYTVNYLEEGTEKMLAAAKPGEAAFEESVTENAIAIDGYTLTSGNSKTITIGTEDNVINFYYAADNFGGGENGDDGDGTPDKYQKKVIFKVVNGAWADGTAADKFVYLDLMKDGEYAVDGTAELTAPTGMKANAGYTNGSWDITPPAEVNGTATETYTFSFVKRTDLELTVNHVEKLTNDTLVSETKTAQIFGDVIDAASLIKDFTGFKFDSASAENITIGTGTNEITLYYVRNSYDYTVNYLEEGTDKVLAAAKPGEAAFEESVTENAIAIDGYTVTGESSKTITIDVKDNVINFYYAADNFGGGENGDEGDGTPDKYQKKVIFKVVNGAWADGTAADKFVYLDLMKDGKYAVDGTAELTAPTGMIANNGYTGGLWDVTPPTEVNGTATETYTFSFVKRTDLELTVNHVEKLTNDTLVSETKTAQVFGDVIDAASLIKDFKGFTFDSASADNITIGTGTNEITLYYVRNSYDYTVNYLEEGTDKVLAAAKTTEAAFDSTVTEEAIVIDGYTLTSGNSKTITIGTEDNVINFYYAADNFGGGENGDEGDGTPDKYQKKVIFKVVNGAWADGTAADKFVYLDLMKDGKYAVDGTAALTAPTGMKANAGYTNGSWDITPPAEVNGTATETYTFSFVKRTDLVLTVKHIVLGEGTVLGSEAKENLTFGDVITAESLIKDFKGFTFDSASENSITIGTGTNEITLYYARNNYSYTVNYLEEGTEKVLAAAKPGEAAFEESVTENAIAIDGYTLTSGNSKTITIGTEDNVINFYYAADNFGGGENGDEGDGTPDKYQKKVIFKVVNGTWADGTAADKFIYLDLMKDGEYAVDGTAELTAPTGMIANNGYTGGLWDVTPPAEVNGTATETYTFSFVKRIDLELTVNHVEKLTNDTLVSETKTAQVFGDVIDAASLIKDFKGFKFDSASAENITIGTGTNEITLYYVRNSYDYTVNYLEEGTDKVLAAAKTGEAVFEESVTENAIAIDGYTVTGESSKTIKIDIENNVINFYYAADNFGGGENGDEGDGTPDKYQKKVIFKVVNGAWSDGTAADKFVYLDLMKDGKYAVDGTAALTAPTGMKANAGYKNGSWDAEIPAVVSGTETLVYTYKFLRATTPVEPAENVKYIVEHYKEAADGTYVIVAEDTGIYSGKIGDTVTATSNNYEGYCFNTVKSEATSSGVLKAISNGSDILTLKLYYDIDTVGGGENGDDGDGTPDKYQKKVIFKVVNGAWSDGTAADKFVYLDLMKDGKYAVDGTATLTAPAGMIANEGFGGGKWLIVPPSIVTGSATETYTFYFEKNIPGYVVEIPDRVTVYEEESTDIKVEIIPNEGTDESEVPEVKSYESTDESIAIVDQNGKVTGVKEGITTVIVTFTDGTQKTVVVVVREREGIHVVFGKTDGIGWYRVSRDGGKTFETVFGNSTLEVKRGTQLIIKVGDLMGDTFVFYVNGEKVQPDDNGNLVVDVNGYMLIGALGYDFEVPDVEESLNWFQKIIKAIKDFFAMIAGWFKK